MKQKICLAAMVLYGAFTSGAHASAVTLYGILDEGPTFVTNVSGNHRWSLDSGELQQSRFGFQGTEDLGGGYSAFFRLEQGFNLSNGAEATTGLAFHREARVALQTPAGSISMGRQPAPTVDALTIYSSAGMTYGPAYYSAHPGDLDRTLNIPIDNSVKYTSPTYLGFTAIGLWSFGGQPGDFLLNSTRSAALTYANGPISAGAAYMRAFGANVTNAALFSIGSNPIGPTGPNDSLQTFGFGASYQFTNLLVHLLFTQSRFDQAQTQARVYEIGIKKDLTPFLVLGADYNYTQVRDRAHIQVGSVSADYFLSKRTDIYGLVAMESASGRNASGGELNAQIFTLPASSSSRQLVVHLGLRHRF
ncbi:porin [Paraburkholderia domus]|uniref:porin n=1 Tax=Paraburkholderia domus TaxID=2793075 RepID=UPI00191352A8|nr:porin [Paraburkholderia domus]MBK5066306.1 porin [Burkholderia sp. R-70199]CAE6969328.1 Outer membrane porin protein 32 [Paraburkholderia domus]